MLYLRHAQKSYKNGDSISYPLDPPIIPECITSCRQQILDLISIYGVPSKIITSPFLRARETAKIVQEVLLQSHNINIPLFVDSSIGEYLGNVKVPITNNSFQNKTTSYNPIKYESWKQFNFRIEHHINTTLANGWYITHGLIIQTISKKYGITIKYPEEITGVYIDNDKKLHLTKI